MIADTLAELLKLPPADRADLAMALWESLSDADREVEFPLTPELIADLEHEIAAHEKDPSSSVPWETVRRRLIGAG